MKTLSSFFFIFIICIIPVAHGATANAGINAVIDALSDDDFNLDPGEELDLSEDVEEITETVESIGGQNVTLSQKVTLNSADAEPIELANNDLDEVVVEIPNGAGVAGPATWDGTIAPPTVVATSGTAPTGFQTPSSSIAVGDPNVVLVFDTPVTILIQGITGQTAYKLSGSSTWILISTCGGTYANPSNPPVNGECSISNDTDTKILTYHFTQFAGISASAPSAPTPAPSTGSSGGGGEVGVGSPRVFGGSSGGGGYNPPSQSGNTVPAWFDYVKHWYRNGDISATEFLNCYNWIVSNILK